MIKKYALHISKKLVVILMLAVLAVSALSIAVYADDDDDDRVVVVSLGDSYSSGEGIEPFYGQEKEISQKIKDYDWVAHRSELSWSSQLVIPGISGTLAHYKVDTSSYNVGEPTSSECAWYFVAASGATTENLQNSQRKTIDREDTNISSVPLRAQLNVFDQIKETTGDTVDYVTITIGGNDVKFSEIITSCVAGSAYLNKSIAGDSLNELLYGENGVWANMGTTKDNLKQAYEDIQEAAGEQAAIIVAGYPKLLKKNWTCLYFSKDEVNEVNTNVSKFNDIIEELVEECAASGMNIYFVDVEEKFDEDGGHQAYTSDAWINKVMFGMESEDLEKLNIFTGNVASAYSMHPNAEGAKAYAECVNEKIAEIEKEIENSKGTLSGKVCAASDRVTPIAGASVSVYNTDGTTLYKTTTTDSTGNYSLRHVEGDYLIKIEADGYVLFTAYATITAGDNTYMETFMMVQGTDSSQGTATGTITDALTGAGINGAFITIWEGWNNSGFGGALGAIATDSSGNYSVTLPLGNYTLCAEKDGYISALINIIVQEGTTDSQNGTMSSIVSGDSYRIVLTWGENPRDLDSHVVGTLSDGSSFHTYYSNKSVYDGSVEACNLDVDDTSSYGPETITLNATTSLPYYYYIYRYAGDGTVAGSEAQIKVYKGDTLVRTFNVPIDMGSDDYWNVFAIVNGQIVVRNTITSEADTSYAD